MTIKIKLTAAEGSTKGINFDKYMTKYFADFKFEGWPYMLGGSSTFEGAQMVLLDNIKAEDTKVIVFDGRSFSYKLSTHVVSGTLTKVRLGTLGDSYVPPDTFSQDGSGRIVGISAPVEISGLSIAGSEFHELVKGAMGGVTSGRKADGSILRAAIADEAQSVTGSKGSDTYTGTGFSDKIKGNAGNDALSGAKGNDRIEGGSGNDKIYGGIGADKLYGGAESDTFIFKSPTDSMISKSGRDTIFDFNPMHNDQINLSAMDANSKLKGNQTFSFLGLKDFSGEAGELRYEKAKSDTYIYGDVNGDKRADFAIHLDDSLAMERSYFIL
jgi:serralysin